MRSGDSLECVGCHVWSHKSCHMPLTAVERDESNWMCQNCMFFDPEFTWQTYLVNKYGSGARCMTFRSTKEDIRLLETSFQDACIDSSLFFHWTQKFEASCLTFITRGNRLREALENDESATESSNEDSDKDSQTEEYDSDKENAMLQENYASENDASVNSSPIRVHLRVSPRRVQPRRKAKKV